MARALAIHRLPTGDIAEVIKLVLKAFILRRRKQRSLWGGSRVDAWSLARR